MALRQAPALPVPRLTAHASTDTPASLTKNACMVGALLSVLSPPIKPSAAPAVADARPLHAWLRQGLVPTALVHRISDQQHAHARRGQDIVADAAPPARLVMSLDKTTDLRQLFYRPSNLVMEPA